MGQLSRGIHANDRIAQIIALVESVLPKLVHLVANAPFASEVVLNQALTIALNQAATNHPYFFHPEFLERPSGTSPKIDIGTVPRAPVEIAAVTYGTGDSCFSMEAKRLPAPSPEREREYLIGHDDKCRGGIERFKAGKHASKLKTAAMIGYLQIDTATHWCEALNGWLTDLRTTRTDWQEDTFIDKLDTTVPGVCRLLSSHRREHAITNCISLFHLWVDLRSGSDS